MSATQTGYFRRLWAALRGRDIATAAVAEAAPAAPADEQLAAARAKAATLEMELRERDQQIETMRREYEALKADKERGVREAGRDEVEKLLKRLTGPLSNLMALVELAEAGQDVQAADLATLVRGMEKELARAGLEPIGKAGGKSTFDVALHQRMSGGAVRDGTPVTVRQPGYRLGQKVLLKAMVSAGEDADGQGRG
jgi:molecular chaperone GrpE (heat shock protein)